MIDTKVLKEEFGLVVLKPDGNTLEKRNELKLQIALHEMQYIVEKEVMLSSEEVERNFIANNVCIDEYISYITSGSCCAVIVRGSNASFKLQKLKKSFREKFGYSSKHTRNLIHTVDQGNEYYQQFNVFFPDLDIRAYSTYGDLTIHACSKHEETIAKLESVEDNTNLSHIGLLYPLSCSNERLVNYKASGVKLGVVEDIYCNVTFKEKACRIIAYLQYGHKDEITVDENSNVEELIGYFKRNGAKIFMDYVDYQVVTDEFIESLVYYGFDGIVTYDPRHSLEVVEELEDRIIEAGLTNIGGSNNVVPPATLSIGQQEVIEFLSLFQ